MWRKFFFIKGIRPGVVIYPPPFGSVDFRRDDLDPEMLREIFERDLPYVKMTDAGMDHFYDNKVKELREERDEEIEEAQREQLFKAKDLVKAIEDSTTEDQARYYYGLGKQYVSVQKAFDKKLNDLQPE